MREILRQSNGSSRESESAINTTYTPYQLCGYKGTYIFIISIKQTHNIRHAAISSDSRTSTQLFYVYYEIETRILSYVDMKVAYLVAVAGRTPRIKVQTSKPRNGQTGKPERKNQTKTNHPRSIPLWYLEIPHHLPIPLEISTLSLWLSPSLSPQKSNK